MDEAGVLCFNENKSIMGLVGVETYGIYYNMFLLLMSAILGQPPLL